MDFNQLLAKMNELSKPAPAETAVVEQPVSECPPAMGPGEPMGDMGKADTPPPSMSVNLNAQGMDNIEELLKLVTKVNPDMDKPADSPMGGMPPSIEIEPMDKPAGGLPPLGGLGNLDSGPLKMLPDFDADNDNKVGGEEPKAIDMDGEEEPEGEEGEEEKDETFGNSLDNSEPETMGIDAAVPNGNDLNKPKTMVKHSYRQGDNPMAMEGEELRAWIKSELTQRLAEAKGAK